SAGESGSTPTSAGDPASAEAAGDGLAGTSLLESARREAAGQQGPKDRDVVIEYFAEGTYRPQVTLVRGDCKLTLCPGDPELLFDLSVDPDELSNRAGDPAYAETLTAMRSELESRYDLEHLDDHVLDSQRSRQLVADALKLGTVRHWDVDPEPEHGHVRGDVWSAVDLRTIPASRSAAVGTRPSPLPTRRRWPTGSQRVFSFPVGLLAAHSLSLGWHDSQ